MGRSLAMGLEPVAHHGSMFRGRMGDRLKILHWDGQGFCLYYKVLERGHFPWPKATAGKVALTPAQMAMLWEVRRIRKRSGGSFSRRKWRQPRWTSAPTRM